MQIHGELPETVFRVAQAHERAHIWRLNEDNHGLKLQGKLAINTKRGGDAYALLKMKPRPAYDGLSIGYVAKDFDLHKNGSGPNGARRTLKSVDLKEISVVTFPADKFSRVGSVKAAWHDTEQEDEETLVKNNAAALARWAEGEWAAMRRLNNHIPR